METLQGKLKIAHSYSVPKYVAKEDGVYCEYDVLDNNNIPIISHNELIIPKEAFVAAYDMYIENKCDKNNEYNMDKLVIEKVLGVDLKVITNDGKQHTVTINNLIDNKNSSVCMDCDKNRIPQCKIDIHLECKAYSFKIDQHE